MTKKMKAPAAATAEGLREDDPATSEIVPGNSTAAGAAQLISTIKAHIAKGDKAADKAEQHYIAAGQHLKQLKAEHDGHDGTWAEWEELLKEKIGIGKSRASELMRIADGTKTIEQVRADTTERTAKTRALQSSPLRSGENADDPETSAEIMKAKFAATDGAAAVDDADGSAPSPLVPAPAVPSEGSWRVERLLAPNDAPSGGNDLDAEQAAARRKQPAPRRAPVDARRARVSKLGRITAAAAEKERKRRRADGWKDFDAAATAEAQRLAARLIALDHTTAVELNRLLQEGGESRFMEALDEALDARAREPSEDNGTDPEQAAERRKRTFAELEVRAAAAPTDDGLDIPPYLRREPKAVSS